MKNITAFSLLTAFMISFSCSNEEKALREQFADPPERFRPLIITHSRTLTDPAAIDWIEERRAGGTVLDAGVRPGGKDSEEMWVEPSYLDDPELFAGMRSSMEELKQRGLSMWIYDELGYPSASAGGRVLEGHPEYALWAVNCRTFLPENRIVKVECGTREVEYCVAVQGEPVSGQPSEILDLTHKARKGSFVWEAPEGEWKVCLFERYQPDTWKRHNARRRNVNIMDRKAVARFIELTHERYAAELGEQLQDVELFFTDEPQFGATEPWIYGAEKADPAVQWCDELPEAFQAKKGYPVSEALPYLFNELGPETGRYRYDFYDVQSDLVAENYFGQLQDWCHEHGLWSSGHLLLEESLLHHLMWTGSFTKNWMRMDLPGVDLLLSDPSKVDPEMAKLSLPGDQPRYKTMGGWHDESVVVHEDFSCKMAASVAHLTGKPGVFTESFALSQNATLPRVKGVTAWQFATGITHMSTYGIQNELSAEDYALFADFAGRLGLLCRRGTPVADVAVLVPEASVWASFNPPDGGLFPHYIACNPDAVHIDHVFRETCHRLSANQRDYEILSEQLLEDAGVKNGRLVLGGMEFAFLLLPECRMLQPSTMKKLEDFVASGGHVAFVGSLPSSDSRGGLDERMTEHARELLEVPGTSTFHAADLSEMASMLSWMDTQVRPALDWQGAEEVRLRHRREKDREIILLANPSLKDTEGRLIAEYEGAVSFWDAATGEILELGKHKPGEAMEVSIPAESAGFIVIE